MKTILEWYEDLPEPIRSQAIENYNPNWRLFRPFTKSATNALRFGFNKSVTPQGKEYWLECICDISHKEFDKR
jgi:hypothetical protein